MVLIWQRDLGMGFVEIVGHKDDSPWLLGKGTGSESRHVVGAEGESGLSLLPPLSHCLPKGWLSPPSGDNNSQSSSNSTHASKSSKASRSKSTRLSKEARVEASERTEERCNTCRQTLGHWWNSKKDASFRHGDYTAFLCMDVFLRIILALNRLQNVMTSRRVRYPHVS